MSDDPKPGGLRASQTSWLNVTQEVSYSVWTNSQDRSLVRSCVIYTPEVARRVCPQSHPFLFSLLAVDRYPLTWCVGRGLTMDRCR